MNNYEQAKKLFAHLWRGGQWAFFWVNPGKTSFWFPATEIPARIKPDFSRNLYFGVHPCTAIPTHNSHGQPAEPRAVRSQLPAVAAINCLFAELDAKDAPKDDLLIKARLLTPPPTVIIDSGGGYHLYWLLDKPLPLQDADTREYVRQLQRRWVRYVGGDKGASDLARVLRVPGSRNWKPAYAPDFPEINFVRWLNLEYSLHQLTGVLPAEPQRAAGRATVARTGNALDVARAMIARAPDGEKHTELLKAARLVGGYVAGGELDYADAFRELCAAIDDKAGVVSKDAAYQTIIDGLEYGALAPLKSHNCDNQ